LILGLGWPLIGAYGLVGAGIAWLVAVTASQLLAAWYARRLFDEPFRGLAAPMLTIAAAAGLATLVAALTGNALGGASGLAASVAASAATAVFVTLVLDRTLRLGILETVSGPIPWLRRFAVSPPA
jgi:O-antigen/teichoic acid export membrane protein